MITNLKDNQLTKNLATGAVAISILAGVGLAASPAQAAWLTLTPPSNPETPSGTTNSEYWREGQLGYDNALLTVTGDIGEVVTLDFNYLGNGSATQTNNFEWRPSLGLGSGYIGGNGDFIFTGVPGSSDYLPCGNNPTGCWNGNPADSGNFVDNAIRTITLTATTAVLPFRYIANVGTGQTVINNGAPDNSLTSPHYLAVLGDPNLPAKYPFDLNFACSPDANPTNPTCKSDVVGLGLSDRPFEATDNDASDNNVKISIVKTPEPGTVAGLLAISILGATMKRKKRS